MDGRDGCTTRSLLELDLTGSGVTLARHSSVDERDATPGRGVWHCLHHRGFQLGW